MNDAQKVAVMKDTLEIVLQDAEMALSGAWDKSDDGFKDQIYIVERALEQVRG